ncbi:MAG TPA: hypothetical protein VGH27_34640 [Streptosporangiaceae bacterium]
MVQPRDLVRWLASGDLGTPSGHCLSWWNPDHAGYAYPEISGLLLRLLALADVAPARRQGLRHALLEGYAPGQAVQRGGQGYTFDTAMALAGLLATTQPADLAGTARDRAAGGADLGRAALGWTTLLITAAQEADAAPGQPAGGRPAAGTRWSMAFGAHQAKVCGALLEAERVLGPRPDLSDAITACATAALAVQEDDGRFRIHAASPLTYTHSHCYAVEGLLMRAAARRGANLHEAAAGAAWLAAAQQPDGSLRAWHDGRTAAGPARADATAQALRIWVLVDHDRFAGQADRARGFLSGLCASPRGLRYEPGSGDVNAWATIFATQALTWHADPAGAHAARIV